MASKNVVLVDKQKNQLAPATVADQVAMNGSNVKQIIDHLILHPSEYGQYIGTISKRATVTEVSGELHAEVSFYYIDMDLPENYQILGAYWEKDSGTRFYDGVTISVDEGNEIVVEIDSTGLRAGYVWIYLIVEREIGVSNTELTDLRLGADGEEYDTAGEAVRTQLNTKVPFPLDDGDPDYGTAGQALLSKGDGTTEWGAGGGGSGVLWDSTDVYLFRQVLSKLKYDSADAGTIANQLLTSLEQKPSDEGWSGTQIDLLDSLLSHVKYTDDDGGEYADQLIQSLKGLLPTYEDADEVEY